MLLSTVMTLVCECGGPLGDDDGRLLHAWLLDRIAARDPALAARLHSDRGNATAYRFAIAPLYDARTGSLDRSAVHAGDELALRIGAAGEEACVGLTAALENGSATVRLGRRTLRITDVAFTSDAHPRAARVPAAELLAFWSRAADVPTHFEMRFESPTAFRSQGQNLLFPAPPLLFTGLVLRWNALGVGCLGDDLVKRLKAETLVSEYELRTTYRRYRRFPQKGFVGRCEFVVPRADDEAARAAHLLADFAYFVGIGCKTPMGMGSIALVPHYAKERPRQPSGR